ncbi:hypothetical protein GBAR_LOCUS8006 [Geodia barretti]|uniref:Uncharacterized protein n=1 Tax=Geodia barretti TaxID=519541 RepID=A0AA35RJ44_GEOBA|nr:hypothetical protein GBAR_LOCUS8006 [Geodia barretti]
MSKKRLHLWMI